MTILSNSGKSERRNNIFVYLFCILSAGLFLTICSRSSFLYPMNDWCDVQMYFTVGKSVFNGRVLYRDIYEQKGLIVSVIYGLAYLISDSTLIGGYIIEILSLSFLSYLGYKTAKLFDCGKCSILIVPLIPAITVMSCYSFMQGGSSDEIMMPFVYLPLYFLIKSYKTHKSIIPCGKDTYIIGVCAGLILWCKYNSLAISLAYVVGITVFAIVKKQGKEWLSAAGIFLLGVVTVTVPVLIYFAANHALGDMFTAYFYNNIFHYQSGDNSIGFKIALALVALIDFARYNIVAALFIITGFTYFFAEVRKGKTAFGLTGLFMYVMVTYSIYGLGRFFSYYTVSSLPLAIPGICILLSFMNGKLKKETKQALISAASVVTCLVLTGLSYFISDNTFFMKYKKEDLWQYQFAAIINQSEDKTVLSPSFLDEGIYTLTDTFPQQKFYCTFNVDSDEMRDEINSNLENGTTKYLVVHDETDPLYDKNYTMIAHVLFFYEHEDVPMDFYLYERNW